MLSSTELLTQYREKDHDLTIIPPSFFICNEIRREILKTERAKTYDDQFFNLYQNVYSLYCVI